MCNKRVHNIDPMANKVALSAIMEKGAVRRLTEDGLPGIGWAMDMPSHLDTEKIQLNLSRFGAIHRVGAFSASIISEYQGETSESNNIMGINADGSALAGKTKSRQVESSDCFLGEKQHYWMANTSYAYGYPVVIHRVNRPEAVQNVIGQKEEGKTDEQAWAKVLDMALRESFREAGRLSLVNRIDNFQKAITYFVAGMIPCSIILNDMVGPVVYTGTLAASIGIDSYRNRKLGLHPFRERRWSVFLSNQVDRYIALNGLSRVPGLVTARQ